jgi:indolepyruvate ferredoxin oxidoreductase
VARYLFKLMAYKDEYEVARLHTDAAFAQQIADMFEGDYKLVHHLAPPLLAKTNDKGELVKQAYGPWMRSALAAGEFEGPARWRAGHLRPQCRAPQERALIGEYEAPSRTAQVAQRQQPCAGR